MWDIRKVIITIMFGIIIWFAFAWLLIKKQVKLLQQELKKTVSALRSSFVKHGQMFEQHIPFAHNFEDKAVFKFLGMPIDGIAFRDDKIIFYEFKTGKSQLNGNQRRVKKQIEDGKIEFKELRY